MPLTTAQLQAVKTDILNDSSLNVFLNNPDGNVFIANVYNLIVSPDFWVWRTYLSSQDIYSKVSSDGTIWSWSIFIARSVAEKSAWTEMISAFYGINPSLLNSRTGIADIFSGAGGLPQRTHLLAIGRRLATRIEKLLATGTGTTAVPATMVFEGSLTYQDVELARNS